MPRPMARNRERAISRLQGRESQSEVSTAMDMDVSAMCDLWRCFQATGYTHDAHRTGRPRMTSSRQDQPILSNHLRDSFMWDTDMARITVGSQGRAISDQTVNRWVREGRLLHCRPQRRPILTARHRQQHLVWAQHHPNCT